MEDANNGSMQPGQMQYQHGTVEMLQAVGRGDEQCKDDQGKFQTILTIKNKCTGRLVWQPFISKCYSIMLTARVSQIQVT